MKTIKVENKKDWFKCYCCGRKFKRTDVKSAIGILDNKFYTPISETQSHIVKEFIFNVDENINNLQIVWVGSECATKFYN